MEYFFIEDIKFIISKYLKLDDAKNFFSLNKYFRKQFILLYDISIVNYSKLDNNLIYNGLLENIRHIRFDSSFNQQLDKLLFNRRSQSLTSLKLGDSFNQQVDKLLFNRRSQSLASLSLGESFNQRVDKLPPLPLLLSLIIFLYIFYFWYYNILFQFTFIN